MPEGFYDTQEAPPSPSRSVATEASFASAMSRLPTAPAGIAAEQRATLSPRPPSMPPLDELRQQNEQSQENEQNVATVPAPIAGAPVSVTRQGSTIRISFSQHQPENSNNNSAVSGAAPAQQGEQSAVNAANMSRNNNYVNPTEASSTTAAATSTMPGPLAAALARQAAANAASGQASASTVDQLNPSSGSNASGGSTTTVPPELAAALALRAAAHAAATQGGGNASASNVAPAPANNNPGSVAEQLAAALATRAAVSAAQGGGQAGATRHIVFNHTGAHGGQQGISIVRNAAGEHEIIMPQQQSQQGAVAAGADQQPGGMSQRVLVNNPHAPNVPGEGVTIIRGQNGEQHFVQQRGGRTSIRIPPGARQIRIPAAAQQAAAVNGNQGNNPNVITRVPIPQLVAQAIPTSSRDPAQPEDADDEALDKYRCNVCYEFFASPSSCGKCSSRFCHGCLLRVANTTVNGATSKCPACRALLTADGIVLDTALSGEMKEANLQVLCSYRGCNQRLAAAAMKEHELSCEFTPMRCRNSTMGCPWHGHRKDLRHHLMAHCHVERVAGVVDQFRHTRADHESAIVQLQRSQTMSNQMVEVNAGLMRRALPSPTNIFDLINLIYTVSCTTAYFLYTADIWRLFLVQQGAQESRAAVANLLYMAPTVFNVCRTAIGGYRIMLTLNVEQDLQLFVDNMELGLLSITPFFLMLSVGLCLLLDGESSFKWSTFKYIGKYKRTILRDMATLALFVINIVIIETDDAGLAAVCFWLCVVSATCFFPPIILTVLGSASGISEPNPQQVFSAGRDAPVVLFALRHAAISGFLGFLPAIDAAIIGQLLRRHLLLVRRYDLVPASDGILSSIGAEYLAGFLGIRFAMWAIETRFDDMPWITLISSVAYLLVNFLFHQLTLIGITIGTLVFREGRANVLPSKLGVRNAFGVYGTVAFCLWSSMLMFLAATF